VLLYKIVSLLMTSEKVPLSIVNHENCIAIRQNLIFFS